MNQTQRKILIQLNANWKSLIGFGYGFHQPTLRGSVRVSPELMNHLPRIHGLYVQIISKGGIPFQPPALPSSLRDVPQWLMIWLHTFQVAHKLPLFEIGQVAGGSSEKSSHWIQDFITPYCHPISTQQFMSWLVEQANVVTSRQNTQVTEEIIQTAEKKLKLISDKSTFYKTKGINIERMLRVAINNKIPFTSLTNQIYAIGQGVYVRWLDSTFTDATSHLGTVLAKNKLAAGLVLKKHGLPVAAHSIVYDEKDAIEKAEKLGYPVVIKPVNCDGGVGVHAGLKNSEQVKKYYKEAKSHSNEIMIEKHFDGRDYRLTVFQGRLIKAVERTPGGVIGDGVLSINALVNQFKNSHENLRRVKERRSQLLALDDEAMELLAEYGLDVDHVPEINRFIPLRRRANVSTGGTTRLVISEVHADNAELAKRAAHLMRLDIAGIDLLIPDIAKSWLETGAIICEVNAQPQVGENNTPGLYLDMLHELLQGDGRIPITLFIYEESIDQEKMNQCVKSLWSLGQGTLVVTNNELNLDGQVISKKQNNYITASQAAILNIEAKRVFIWTSLDELFEQGLPSAYIDHLILLKRIENISSKIFDKFFKLVMPHIKNLYHNADDELARYLSIQNHKSVMIEVDLSKLDNIQRYFNGLGKKV